MEEKVIIAKFGKTKVAQTEKQWRYNHGQKLKFEGVDLPANYEVHFSNSKTGTAKTMIGNADGVLIPQEFFVPGEMIYAWVYVEEDGVGVTRREVRIPIDQKARPTDQQPLPEEQTVIEQAIEALNDAVNEIPNEITTALAGAKASGTFDGTRIWWVFVLIENGAPDHDGRILKRGLKGKEGEVPLVGDFVYGPAIGSENRKITDLYVIEEITGIVVFLKHLDSIKGEDGFDPEIVIEEIPNGHRVTITSANGSESFDVMNGTFEVTGPLSMENYRLTDLADGVDDTDAVNKSQVEQMIREGSGLFRGSFSTKASLNMASWQSEDPTQPYYVDNNDYCVVLSDETQHYECWRYGYVVGSGWVAQYRINEAPMTIAQIAAINSGITADRLVSLEQFKNTAQSKLSGIEAGAQVNKIEQVRVMDPVTGLYKNIPIVNKIVDIPGQGVTVFDFVYDKSSESMRIFPTFDEVLEAGPCAMARFKFFGESDEIYIPVADNIGNFVGVVSRDTAYLIHYNNAWWYEELPIGGGSVTVDDDFSATSENPVQNKVITGAFNQAAQQLTNLGLALDAKVDKVSGKGLSTNDFTNNDKNKLDDAATESWVQQQGYLLGGDLNPYRTAAQQNDIDEDQNAAIAAKYTKPSSGVPKTDLEEAVQTSLGKADSALQSYTETDPTVPSWAKQSSKPSYTASEVGAVAVAQGAAHAGEFMGVGSDGNITTKQQNEEVTVSATGAVTQALDAGKLYHFTGDLTALTITLNAAPSGQLAQYHFDFDCGSTAPTVTLPASVTMPDGNSFDASKHYEVDILNNFGAVMAWATS